MVKMIVTVLIGVVILILAVFLFFQYKFTHFKRRKLQYLKPVFPWGNVQDTVFAKMNICQCMAEIYKEGRKRNANVLGLFICYEPVTLLIDLDLIKSVLLTDFNQFHSRGLIIAEEVDPLTGNFTNVDGDKWRSLRSTLTPLFSSLKLKQMFPILLKSAEEVNLVLDEHISKCQPIDLMKSVRKLITNVVGSTIFGLEVNSLTGSDNEVNFANYIDEYFDRGLSENYIKVLFSQLFPSFYRFFKIPITPTNITEYFMSLFQTVMDERKKSGRKRNDIIDVFLKLNADEDASIKKKIFSYRNLTGFAFIFAAAGLDSTSSALTASLLELSLNLDIQSKLRREILDVLKKYKGEVTYEAINEMKYMDQVLYESMRKYPQVALIPRMCNEDYYTSDGKLLVKKGEIVVYSILGVHKDPELYPDPEKFDPERFSSHEKAKRHPMSFLAFGDGPRNCIGNRFAIIQLKIALTYLLKNYRYTLNPKTTLPCVFDTKGIFMRIKNTIWLDIHKIS